MRKSQFLNTHIRAGVWEGEFTGKRDDQPALQATLLDSHLEGLTCSFDDTRDVWRVRLPIPAALINDGVQTCVISDASGETVTSFTLIAGDPLANDLRAEITLLRHELDLLKRAFRRHCSET